MEKGESSQYRGKSLDEINVNVEETVSDVEESSSDLEEEKLTKPDKNDDNIITSEIIAEPHTVKNKKSTKCNKQINLTPITRRAQNKNQKIVIIPWADEDKIKLNSYFKKNILLGKVPNKKECEDFMKTYPCINKPWQKIKNFVHNAANSQKKKLKK